MRIFTVLIIAALAAGCMVGPDYIRPKIDVPAAYRFEDKEAQDTANTLWWRQFQDPVLDALIIEALSNNKSIRIAAANVEKAAGVLTQTRSSLFPQIDYSGSGCDGTVLISKNGFRHNYQFFYKKHNHRKGR